MEQKVAFVKAALRVPRGQMSALCERYGIARKTGYKWLKRYRTAGTLTALAERSRRPRRSPTRLKLSVAERIRELRAPDGWGARKLAQLLWEEGVRVSVATVHRTLLREGLVHRLDRHGPAPRRFERAEPNDLLQADFKGPMGRAGQRDEPLTVLDDHSRFALGVFALRDHTGPGVQRCFEAVFVRYGVPRQLLLDHGTPWWNHRNGCGLSRLAVFLVQQGIGLVFSRVGHPQTQGKVERFHRTLARSMTRQGPPARWEEWQPRYDSFVGRYNWVRPHEALGMRRPAECYRPSPRRYQPEVPAWRCPAGLEVARVDAGGTVRIGGHRYFVCEALAQQEVALEPLGAQVLVRFRQMYLRELDLEGHTTQPFVHPVAEVLPMC